MRSAKEQRESDRILVGLCGGAILLWFAFAVWFYPIIMTPDMDGPMFLIAAIMAGAGAALAVFIGGLIAIAILMLAAAVLK